MKIDLDSDSATPVFQQLVDAIHFLINTGELKPGEKLPSVRSLASEYSLAPNTVAKAMRQLEFRGVIAGQERSGYTVTLVDKSIGRYQARGVSSDKTEVHNVVDNLDHGLFPNAFCKITEDYLTGNPEQVPAGNLLFVDTRRLGCDWRGYSRYRLFSLRRLGDQQPGQLRRQPRQPDYQQHIDQLAELTDPLLTEPAQ